MTVLELIEELEEVEDLDVVLISKDGVCHIYEGDDIDFIDYDILNLPVKDYEVQLRTNKKHKYRLVNIEI